MQAQHHHNHHHGSPHARHSRPEPMNSSPHHPKVNVTVRLPPDPVWVAGTHVSGKIELECKADRGLSLGNIKAELFAIEELTSRDHSATSTFLHTVRLFQGPGLPPSNAVLPHTLPGESTPPTGHYPARRGKTSFLFRFPLPRSAPSALAFAGGLARVHYELRASAEVCWRGARTLVTTTREVQVAQALEDEDESRAQAVTVAENGRIWVQARVLGGVLIAGTSACVELQVKNHSTKKNTGLTLTFTRSLHLPSAPSSKPPLELSDTLARVDFSAPEYIISPGVEGVAHLVFDVPPHACGVRGGVREGEEGRDRRPRNSPALFEVQCVVGVRMPMGLTNKPVELAIPVQVVHSAVLPPTDPNLEVDRYPAASPVISPYVGPPTSVGQGYAYPDVGYASPALTDQDAWGNGPTSMYPLSPLVPAVSPSMSPRPQSPYVAPHPHTAPYVSQDAGMFWLPPPTSPFPVAHGQQYYTAQGQDNGGYAYYLPPPPAAGPWMLPARASSAEPLPSAPQFAVLSPPPLHAAGLPLPNGLPVGLPLSATTVSPLFVGAGAAGAVPATPEAHAAEAAAAWGGAAVVLAADGTPTKGTRASRISVHLRMTSRTRSLSPPPLRHSLGPAHAPADQVPAPLQATTLLPVPPQEDGATAGTTIAPILSPRPMLSPKHSFSSDAPAPTRDPSDPRSSPTGTRGRPKSVRVEALEQMAVVADVLQRDMSADIPRATMDTLHEVTAISGPGVIDAAVEDTRPNRNKSLPGPPVPSGKERALSVLAASRPRVDTLFVPPREITSPPIDALPPPPILKPMSAVSSPSSPRISPPSASTSSPPPPPAPMLLPADTMLSRTPVADHAPPAPVLAAFSPSKLARSRSAVKIGTPFALGMTAIAEDPAPSSSNGIAMASQESGLDLLERKLLAQVGTGRFDEQNSRPGIQPITIPPPGRVPNGPETPLNDSAISSLTLANGRSLDERTQLGEHLSRSPPRLPLGTPPRVLRAESRSPAEEQVRPQEVNKLRRAAKGRVAAWLQGVSPAEPPQVDSIAPSPEMSVPRPLPDVGAVDQIVMSASEDIFHMDAKAPTPAPPSPQDPKTPGAEQTTEPNLRSSGFVPLSTLGRNAASPPLVPPKSTKPAARIKFPPPPKTDPGPKYDVRSARGGRGGRVTAATALWASQAEAAKPSVPPPLARPAATRVPTFADKVKSAAPAKPPAPPPKPPALRSPPSFADKTRAAPRAAGGHKTPPKLAGASSNDSSPSRPASAARAKTPTNFADLTAARARPVKAMSVPAVLSASLATPMLSSTASLARPVAKSTAGVSPLVGLTRIRSNDAARGGQQPQGTPTTPLPTVSEGLGNFGVEGGRRTPRAAASKVLSSHSPRRTVSPERAPKVEMAFGQARLRDLIRKYQGHAA